MPKYLQEQEDSFDQPNEGHQTTDQSDLSQSGRSFLRRVYGDPQAHQIEQTLHRISPRLGYYSVSLVYGGIYSDTKALSTRDVNMLTNSSAIKPLIQIGLHFDVHV